VSNPANARAAVSSLRPAVFFDRDGTLTRESDWVTRPADLELLPGAAEAVRIVNDAGFVAVLVTNQSAIARGLITESDLEHIHAHLATELAKERAHFDAIYHCPHHPTEGVSELTCFCECRKPRPALLARAARELGLDLSRSWIIGDAERDLLAGQALGVRGILVSTGKGKNESARLSSLGRTPDPLATDVLAAVRRIKAGSAPSGPTTGA
jgi:D-glycero-D-manno-heptose 1,7-bisphosphate phosphatase